jgi:hypothetical protein
MLSPSLGLDARQLRFPQVCGQDLRVYMTLTPFIFDFLGPVLWLKGCSVVCSMCVTRDYMSNPRWPSLNRKVGLLLARWL